MEIDDVVKALGCCSAVGLPCSNLNHPRQSSREAPVALEGEEDDVAETGCDRTGENDIADG